MRAAVIIAAIIVVWLQYSLWFGQSGHFTQQRLGQQLAQQQAQVAAVRQRNQLLLAQVIALKNDRSTMEARARSDLGMIKRGETFYIVPRRTE